MMGDLAKRCTKCGDAKPLTEYHRGRADCKACRTAYHLAKKYALTDAAAHRYGKQPIPPGFTARGVSQLVDADGNTRLQWIKSERSKEQALEAFVVELESRLSRGKFKHTRVSPPKKNSGRDNWLAFIPIGDAHIGLMTWWREVGESYDLKVAVQCYLSALELAISASTASKLVLANVGDYFHSDGGKNATTKGTPVDVDGRWPKIFMAGLDILEYGILRGLETHDTVHVINAGGNHDHEANIALTVALQRLFRDNPRVTFSTSFGKFHYIRHGANLIGITHGDTVKPQDLPMIMATDRQEDWADTAHRHWYTGHVHHDTAKDYGPVGVESVRVLVPTDAWHHASGYRSERDIKCDLWHRVRGRRHRHTFGIQEIMDALEDK